MMGRADDVRSSDKGDVVAVVLQTVRGIQLQTGRSTLHGFLIATALRGAESALSELQSRRRERARRPGEIAHVEPLQAGRAFHEMIGFIFGSGICVGPGLRH
jgi:hypothetical protein